MLDISKIIFKRNNTLTIIDFDNAYIDCNGINKQISNDKLLDYLKRMIRIIHNWNYEYINLNTIDGDDWSLDIYFIDGEITNYKGHASYPNNFEQLDDLFTNITREVL